MLCCAKARAEEAEQRCRERAAAEVMGRRSRKEAVLLLQKAVKAAAVN